MFFFVPATWVGRTTLIDEEEELAPITLSTIQKEKFSHFFYNLLDSDRNDLISKDDFDVLSEVNMKNFIVYFFRNRHLTNLIRPIQNFFQNSHTYIVGKKICKCNFSSKTSRLISFPNLTRF